MPLPQPSPTAVPLAQAEPDDHQGPASPLTSSEPNALAQTAVTGERAAAWIRDLAEHQTTHAHHRVTNAREIIPGGVGELARELRYALAADVILGASHNGTLSELGTNERTVLVAVCGRDAGHDPRRPGAGAAHPVRDARHGHRLQPPQVAAAGRRWC